MSGDPDGRESTSLTAFERSVLGAVAEESLPPAGLALELDADFERVLDTVAALQDRGLLARQGFSTCRLTERGRAIAANEAA